MIAVFASILLYKVFDELQDESVNSAWKKPFLGIPLSFLNKRSPSRVVFPDGGWARKWDWTFNDERGEWELIPDTKAPWWYFNLWKPPYKERFIYSYTLFVWLTDGEHLFQLLKDISLSFAVYAAGGSWHYGVAAFLAINLVGLVKELRK